MLPTNVVSFVKKMVATNESPGSAVVSGGDPGEGSTLGKLRQTLSSSLLTATETVTKLSPTRQPASGESGGTGTTEQEENSSEKKQTPTRSGDAAPSRSPSKYGCCRVCLKAFTSAIEFFRVCCECSQKVCEDCASYSSEAEAPPISTDTQSPPAPSGVPEVSGKKHLAMQHLPSATRQPALRPRRPPAAARARRAAGGAHQESIGGSRGLPSTGFPGSKGCCSFRYPVRNPWCRRNVETSPFRCAVINTTSRWYHRNQWRRYSHCANLFFGSSTSVTRYAPPFRCFSCVAARSGKETGAVYVKTKTSAFHRGKRRREVSHQHCSGQTGAETTHSGGKQRIGGGEATPGEEATLPRCAETTKLRRGVGRIPACPARASCPPCLRLRPPATRLHSAGPRSDPIPKFDEAPRGVATRERQPKGFDKDGRSSRQRWRVILKSRRVSECGRSVGPADGSVGGEGNGGRPEEATRVASFRLYRKSSTSHSCSYCFIRCCSKVSCGTAGRRNFIKRSKADISRRCRSNQDSDRRCRCTPSFANSSSNPFNPSSRTASSSKTPKRNYRKMSSDEGWLWHARGRRKRSCRRTTICLDSVDCPWWTCGQSWPLSWRQSFRMVWHMPYRSQLRGSKCHCRRIRRHNRYTCGKNRGLARRLLGRACWCHFYSTSADRCSSNGNRRQVTSLTYPSETSKNSGTIDAGKDREWSFANASVVPRREKGVGSCSACSRRPCSAAEQGYSAGSALFGTIFAQCIRTPSSAARKWKRRRGEDGCSRVHYKSYMECNLRFWRCKSRRFNGKFLRGSIMGPISSFRTRSLLRRVLCGTEESCRGGKTSVVPSRGPEGNPRFSLSSHLTQRLPCLCSGRAGSPTPAQERRVLLSTLLLRRGWWRCIPSNWNCTKSGLSTHFPPPSRCSMGCSYPWNHKKTWLKPVRTTGHHSRRSHHTCGFVTLTSRVKEELFSVVRAGKRGKHSTGQTSKFQCSRQKRVNRSTRLSPRRNQQPSTWPKGKWAHGQNLKCNRFHTFDVAVGKEPVDFSLGGPRGTSTPSDDEEDDSWSTRSSRDETGKRELARIVLGPGQVQPRGFGMGHGFCAAEVKLGLLMSKGQLEVEVVCARNIAAASKDYPPDTYVKTYLRDGPRWLQKRKTRVIRRSMEPQYRQTLRYSARDVLGRSLLIMLWERTQRKGFVIGMEANQGLGGGEIALDRLQLTRLTLAWYPLFPLRSLSGATANASDAYEGPRGPDGGPSSEEEDDGSEDPNMS